MKKALEILKKHWGYDSFRPLQSEIVESVIYGHDTLAILPTGGGKSICFQVPGIALDGIALVISPLIALMQDQVDNLQKRGIKATLLSSSMSYREIDIALDNARFGSVKFLYLSPERLNSPLFQERVKLMDVSLIVVDEAHCISEWGHDFRPAYRDIKQVKEFHPNVPVIALTASATQRVKADIIEQLELRSVKKFEGELSRDNLHYAVRASENKLKAVIDYCKLRGNQSGIVYCQTRRSVKEVVRQLRAQNVLAGFYHGGLSSEDRKYMLDAWMKNELYVMVATNAFGMGIDKPDVRYVLHYEIPNNLEAYYQEAGRAGRDGKSADAVAFWEERDLEIMQRQVEAKYPEKERIKRIYSSLCNFLTIAIGSGENETYDFSFHDFSSVFKFSIAEVYHTLNILQANGDLIFTEQSILPTRLKFVIGSSALYKFQVGNDSVDPLITILTRSYPGIFDRFLSIDEGQIAKRLKISPTELRKKLEYLEQYGVIDITYQSDSPRVTFLRGRQHDDHFQLSPEAYGKRKAIAEEKLETIIRYVKSNECRSRQISEYFQNEGENCGICDVCRELASSNHNFDELLQIIPRMLPASLEELILQTGSERSLVQRAIRSLLLEEKVHFEEGEYVNS